MDIFPVYYFPPVSWFTAIIRSEAPVLEQFRNYRKQHLYNRTRIKGPNKVQNLTVPISRSPDNTPICNSLIAYNQDWQRDHWKSLEAAYRSSPYFEYYEDYLQPYFTQKENSLLRLNLNIINSMLGMLQVNPSYTLSPKYLSATARDQDFRDAFDPRGRALPTWFAAENYQQVFPEFDPDLSILDLLFNLGPESGAYLQRQWKS